MWILLLMASTVQLQISEKLRTFPMLLLSFQEKNFRLCQFGLRLSVPAACTELFFMLLSRLQNSLKRILRLIRFFPEISAAIPLEMPIPLTW